LLKRENLAKGRSFNGKMDLIKARGNRSDYSMQIKKQHGVALEVYQGSGDRKIFKWKEEIKSIIINAKQA